MTGQTLVSKKVNSDEEYANYDALRRNYLASLTAVQLLVANDHAGDQIFALLQAAGGFDPNIDKGRLREFSDDLLDWARTESKSDFQGIRRSYLVNACGALENLAKCCFAAWVNEDPEVVERVKTKRFSLTLSEFLGRNRQDQIFSAADRVFQDIDGPPLAGQIPPPLVTSKSPTLDKRLTVR